MDLSAQYKTLTAWVKFHLVKELHSRHLEDCIQHIAMESIKNRSSEEIEMYGLRGKWNWYLANYCRENGLNRNQYGRKSARILESAIFVGMSTDEDGDPENFQVLENHYAKKYLEEEESEKNSIDAKELLRAIFKKEETLTWALKYYKKGKLNHE